jgi:hypothetical protein
LRNPGIMNKSGRTRWEKFKPGYKKVPLFTAHRICLLSGGATPVRDAVVELLTDNLSSNRV